MLAYPTPTFDAKTILQAPGYRPAGRGSQLVYEEQPEAVTPLNLVNRNTANGGFVGTRAKKFIQNNQFLTPHFDPTKGTPLSKPGSVGNVVDQAISVDPKYAEPENGELKAIMAILNGKPAAPEFVGKLSAKQVESLEKKGKGLAPAEGAKRVVEDFADAREALRREKMIKRAIDQGFTLEEAKSAYNKVRVREAELSLMKEEDPSVRLADLIDSKLGGTQNGSVRGNDETGLYLAKGGNAVRVQKAERRNEIMDRLTQPTPSLKDFTGSLSAKDVTALQSRIGRSMKPVGAVAEFFETGKPITIQKPKPLLMIEDRKPTLTVTPLGEAVMEALRKRGGRPKGKTDTEPRVRRTKAEIAASKPVTFPGLTTEERERERTNQLTIQQALDRMHKKEEERKKNLMKF